MFGFRWAVLLAALFVLGCGDDGVGSDDTNLERPTCDEIASTCHHNQTQLGQECHEFGHDDSSTEEECLDRKEDCLAECAGGGHGH